jgi:excisionase family DNA binding protein
MTHLTIREASQLIGRTSATIRRYIRSGRLAAEKQAGKFGEEYRIRREDLLGLGFSPSDPPVPSESALVKAAPASLAPPIDGVPISLYNELLMKHEQILVQYGMIRAGGQKLLEYKADAEAKTAAIEREKERYQSLRQRAVKEIGFLRKRLREMEMRLEEQRIEIALLQEKGRRIDPSGPASSPGGSFEATLMEIKDQERAIAELAAEEPRPALSIAGGEPWASGFPPLDRKEDH